MSATEVGEGKHWMGIMEVDDGGVGNGDVVGGAYAVVLKGEGSEDSGMRSCGSGDDDEYDRSMVFEEQVGRFVCRNGEGRRGGRVRVND